MPNNDISNDISDVLNGEAAEALAVGAKSELDDNADEPDGKPANEDDDSDADDDGDETDDSADDEAIEVPSGNRLLVDEDDKEEDEELEADLGEILKERLATDEEINEDEDDIGPTGLASKSAGTQEEEITCNGCFLFIRPSQLDLRSGEPACPHCGVPVKV